MPSVTTHRTHRYHAAITSHTQRPGKKEATTIFDISSTSDLLQYFYNFWSILFRNTFCVIWFITYSPSVWGLYPTWHNTRHQVKLLCAVHTDTGFHTTRLWLTMNSPDLNAVNNSVWVSCKRKCSKHTYKLVQTSVGSGVAELDHRHIAASIRHWWWCHLNACDTGGDAISMHVTRVRKQKGGYYKLHVAIWSTCWIVTLLLTDFCALSFANIYTD